MTIIAAVTRRKDALPMWRNLLYWSNSVCYPCPIACIRFVYTECFDYVGMKWQRMELQMWHFDVALFTQLCLLGDLLFVVLVMQLHDFHFARLSDLYSFIFSWSDSGPQKVWYVQRSERNKDMIAEVQYIRLPGIKEKVCV